MSINHAFSATVKSNVLDDTSLAFTGEWSFQENSAVSPLDSTFHTSTNSGDRFELQFNGTRPVLFSTLCEHTPHALLLSAHTVSRSHQALQCPFPVIEISIPGTTRSTWMAQTSSSTTASHPGRNLPCSFFRQDLTRTSRMI